MVRKPSPPARLPLSLVGELFETCFCKKLHHCLNCTKSKLARFSSLSSLSIQPASSNSSLPLFPHSAGNSDMGQCRGVAVPAQSSDFIRMSQLVLQEPAPCSDTHITAQVIWLQVHHHPVSFMVSRELFVSTIFPTVPDHHGLPRGQMTSPFLRFSCQCCQYWGCDCIIWAVLMISPRWSWSVFSLWSQPTSMP